MGVLLGRRKRNAQNFCAVNQAADVPDKSRMAGDEWEQLSLHIDDKECRIVAVHELGGAEKGGRCGHVGQNTGRVRGAECGVRNERETATLVTHYSSIGNRDLLSESGEVYGRVFGH